MLWLFLLSQRSTLAFLAEKFLSGSSVSFFFFAYACRSSFHWKSKSRKNKLPNQVCLCVAN